MRACVRLIRYLDGKWDVAAAVMRQCLAQRKVQLAPSIASVLVNVVRSCQGAGAWPAMAARTKGVHEASRLRRCRGVQPLCVRSGRRGPAPEGVGITHLINLYTFIYFLQSFPPLLEWQDDGPAQNLIEIMEEYNFVAPVTWKGYREKVDM